MLKRGRDKGSLKHTSKNIANTLIFLFGQLGGETEDNKENSSIKNNLKVNF